MKHRQIFLILFPFFVFLSCNNGEGLGGSSSLEGYVYNIVHYDNNFSFIKDTLPAAKQDVYLIFGDDAYFGDDVETDKDGLFRFDYLRKGNYTVYAYSEYANMEGGKERKAVMREVKVGGGLNRVDTIFIHTGDANGTAMIKGSVYAYYMHNGVLRDQGPAVDLRVYIKRIGEDTHFDDVRVGDQGIFVFQKILPGQYEVYTISEDPETEKPSAVFTTVAVTETEIMYNLTEEGEEYTFKIYISV